MSKLRQVKQFGEYAPSAVSFFCPGCGHMHTVNIGPKGWLLTGADDNPTLQPSIVTKYTLLGNIPFVCHLIVSEGFIEYQRDCTHILAGQRVPMEEVHATES